VGRRVPADLLDDPHALVAEDVSRAEEWREPLIEVEIGTAHTVDVIRTMASVGCSIRGSGTSSTRTSRFPCQVTAFTMPLPMPVSSGGCMRAPTVTLVANDEVGR
jgi:hypothetical protein